MKLSPEEQTKLERLITENCRTQPLRSAPVALQQRVFAELAQRAALPWWRKSFAHWPTPIRVAWLLVSVAVAPIMLNLTLWLSGQLAAAHSVARPLSWLENFAAFISFMHSVSNYVVGSVWQHIPATLLYGGIVAVLTMYGLLIALGTVAYRTVYAAR